MNQRLKRDFGMDIYKLAGQPTCIAEGWREAAGYMEVPDAHAQPVAEQCGSSSVSRMPRQSRKSSPTSLQRLLSPKHRGARRHAGLTLFAGQRDGRAQVPMAPITRFSWRSKAFHTASILKASIWRSSSR